jgi:hypothetical protein
MMCDRPGRMVRVKAPLENDRDDGSLEFSLLNLVDLMLVFSLGLMIALVSYYGLRDIVFERQAVAIVKKAGQPEMEIIIKRPDRVERMRVTQESLGGEGVRIGTAYRLKSGEIVYVPDSQTESTAPAVPTA